MDCLMRRFFADRKLRLRGLGDDPSINDGLEAPRPGITPGRVCMMSLVLLFSKYMFHFRSMRYMFFSQPTQVPISFHSLSMPCSPYFPSSRRIPFPNVNIIGFYPCVMADPDDWSHSPLKNTTIQIPIPKSFNTNTCQSSSSSSIIPSPSITKHPKN